MSPEQMEGGAPEPEQKKENEKTYTEDLAERLKEATHLMERGPVGDQEFPELLATPEEVAETLHENFPEFFTSLRNRIMRLQEAKQELNTDLAGESSERAEEIQKGFERRFDEERAVVAGMVQAVHDIIPRLQKKEE